MSENGKVIDLGTAPVEMRLSNGTVIAIPVVTCHMAFADLGDRLKEAGKDTHKDHLEAVIEYVQELTGTRVSLEDADALLDQVAILYLQKKRERKESLLPTPKSPASTGSTPSA